MDKITVSAFTPDETGPPPATPAIPVPFSDPTFPAPLSDAIKEKRRSKIKTKGRINVRIFFIL